MTELSPALRRAIEEAVRTDPSATADDFMRDIGRAVIDARSRDTIRDAWHRASVALADQEGGGRPLDEVCDDLTAKYEAMLQK